MATLWRFPVQPQLNGAGNAVTATTALTSGLAGVQNPIIPGDIVTPGARLSLTANGELTSTSSTPTLGLGFYFTTTLGQAIGSQSALCTATGIAISASATAWQFTMKWDGTIRSLTTGTSANAVIHGQGYVVSFANSGLSAAGSVYPMPVTAAARTVSTWDTRVAVQLDVGVTWSSSTGSDTATITDFWAELTG